MPKVLPRLLSDEFIERHHYHVVDTMAGELLGMFASLYCAAQSVLHGNSSLKHVRNMKLDYNYTIAEMKAEQLSDIVPIDFMAGKADKTRMGVKSSVPTAYQGSMPI